MSIHQLFEISKSKRTPLSLKGFDIYSNNSNNAFNITNNTVSSDVNIYVDSSTTGIHPVFLLLLSINSDTIVINNLQTNNNSDYIYMSYTPPESTTQAISGTYTLDDVFIKYNVNTGSQEILSSGSFIAADYPKPELMVFYNKVSSVDVFDRGSGYKLNSTFYFNALMDNDNSYQEDIVNVDLTINSDTVIISGGKNYQVGDTFTVASNTAIDSSLVTVTEVDKQNGSIIEVIISEEEVIHGITSAPSVTYNGTSGFGAEVTINDNYSIYSITSNLSGYYPIDPQLGNILHAKLNDEVYDVNYASFSFDNDMIIDFNINNNFILSEIKSIISGNNITQDTVFYIQNNNKIYNASEYIDINFNNLIDIPSSQPSRPVF